MTPAPLPPSRRWRTTLIVGVGVLAALAVVLVAGIVFMHTTYFQHEVLRYAASRLSRKIDVAGTLELDLLSSTPTLIASDVTLSNPAWMPPGAMAQMGKLTVVFTFP